MGDAIGRVAALWRYPVKSMLGEARAELALDSRGVEGDRQFAVRTAEGKFGSGKDTRRFRKIEGLFRFRAELEEEGGDVPVVTFPDGTRFRADDSQGHQALSAWVHQPVTLAREAELSHLDSGPVHLVTTASLRALASETRADLVDARRFRPNLVLDVEGESFVEAGWISRELTLGDQVRLRVSAPTERCVMIGFEQSELPEDPRLLRELGRLTRANLGVYAEVLVPGLVRLGEPIRIRS